MAKRSPSLTSQESYRAVIITDLVAEVPVSEDSKTSFQSGDDSKEQYNLKMVNGSNISQGVILNALQFGLPDPKSKAHSLAPVVNQQTQELKDMSVSRKIAFGFSFLPSIMFVLCFAIILPCIPPKSCLETVWTRTLNDTTATSNLHVLSSVLFTFEQQDAHFLVALDIQTGKEVFKEKLSAAVNDVVCQKQTNSEQGECIISDETGKIHVFSGTDGSLQWSSDENESRFEPTFVRLPDCFQQASVLAVTSSKGFVKILSGGNVISSFQVGNCDSRPGILTTWPRDNLTDLILVCKNESRDIISKIPQEKWCPTGTALKPDELSWSLYSELEEGYLIHPVDNDFLLWSGNKLTLISAIGLEKWRISTDLHLVKNRFIFTGSYTEKKKQIALLSSDIASKLQITILNVTNGNMIDASSANGTAARDVIQLHGKKGDFFLLCAETGPKHAVSSTLHLTNDVQTTLMPFLSEERIPNKLLVEKHLHQELAFMGSFDETYRTIEILEGVHSQVSMKAFQDKADLGIMILRSSGLVFSSRKTEIQYIKVVEWDFSAPKRSECLA